MAYSNNPNLAKARALAMGATTNGWFKHPNLVRV